MIDLAQRSEPYEIPLPYGLKVTVRPLTTAGMTAAQAAARRAIERQARERKEAGLQLEGLPDLSGEGERDGFYQAQLIRELGVRHITRSHGSNGASSPPHIHEREDELFYVLEGEFGTRGQLPQGAS